MKSTCLHALLLGISFYAEIYFIEEFEEKHELEGFDLLNDKYYESIHMAADLVNAEDADDFFDDENEHFHDPEEFEGFRASRIERFHDLDGSPREFKETEDDEGIQFPVWYYVAETGIALAFLYIFNYFWSRAKNQKLVTAWCRVHEKLLQENFNRVGERERNHKESHFLKKHSGYFYSLWCTGRASCKGMLVELKLLRRENLFRMMLSTIKNTKDEIHIKVEMNQDDMDSVIFCLASKRGLKMLKDMADLRDYCSEKKIGDRFELPPSLCLLSEFNEVAHALFDSRVSAAVKKLGDFIDYIYISDQFSGVKLCKSQTKYPDTKKVLLFCFHIPNNNLPEDELMEAIFPLQQLVLYIIDRLKKYRLSKEAKIKAEKNRQRVRAEFSKLTHAYRIKTAAARKDEKKRQEKERIMLESDPEKQRKWEDREMKRKMKKKAAKMRKYTAL